MGILDRFDQIGLLDLALLIVFAMPLALCVARCAVALWHGRERRQLAEAAEERRQRLIREEWLLPRVDAHPLGAGSAKRAPQTQAVRVAEPKPEAK